MEPVDARRRTGNHDSDEDEEARAQRAPTTHLLARSHRALIRASLKGMDDTSEREKSSAEPKLAPPSGPPDPAKKAQGQGAEKSAPEEPPEDPEEYADPICVCEPEPYWQEIAERMAREARSSK